MGGEFEVSWIDPEELLVAVPDAPLGSVTTGVELVQAEVRAPVQLAAPGGVVRVEADSVVTLTGLATAEDRDPDGVVGVMPASPRRSPAWRPLLKAGSRYWLRYAARGRVGPRGDLDDGAVELEGDAAAEVVLADYRAHRPSENARTAVLEDLRRPRFAVRAADVRRLAVGDALLLATRAQLRLGLTVRWSDVITAALSRLAEILAAGSLLQVHADLGSLLRVRARVTDDVSVAFARRPGGEIRVQVRTSETSVRARRAHVGVEAGLIGDGPPETVVSAVLEGWLGASMSKVARLIDAVSLEGLDPAERELLRELLVRLDVRHGADLLAALESVRQRWRQLEGDVRAALVEAAKRVVGAELQSSYDRLQRSTVLLEADLSEAAAERLHGALVAGDVHGAVELAKECPGEAEVRETLSERLVQTTSQWGFSLGLGRWRLASEERRQRRWRWRTDGDGRQRVVFLGARHYSSSDPLSGTDASWTVDLRASSDWMPATPSVADLELGLKLALTHEERRLSRREVAAFVDEAVVWHAVDDSDRETVEAAVRATAGRRKVVTRLELRLDHAALIAALDALSSEDEVAATDRLARAMARALPAVHGFPSRELTVVREQLYAPVWKAWLVYDNLEDDDLAAATERALRHTSLGKSVAKLEGRQQRLGEHRPAWSVAEVARRDPDTRALWWSLRHGVSSLLAARQSAQPAQALEPAVASMERFWAQAFHVRVLGAALARAADSRAPVRATFSVTVPNADRRLVVTTTA